MLIVCGLGFSSVQPKPSAVFPGALSTKTLLPYTYNPTNEMFGFEKYAGFREDKLVIGKPSFLKFVDSERKNQKRTFDSLAKGKVNFFGPPSCVHLAGNIVIDEAEVTNIDYQEFLFFVKRDSTDEYFQGAVPTLKVLDKSKADYFSSPQYRFFPIVGLTFEQANEYCKWRGRFITHLFGKKHKRAMNFVFRLPTEVEWELAASNGLDKHRNPYGIEGIQTITYKVNPKASEFVRDKISTSKNGVEVSKDIEQAGLIKDVPFNVKRKLPYFLQFDTPYYTYSFYRNDYGIYKMIGNVAEFIEEKGIAKGGSFRDELPNSKITARRKYDRPSDDIGFRCVCEVVLK